MTGSGWVPVGQHNEKAGGKSFDEVAEQDGARSVDPVDVVEQQQHGAIDSHLPQHGGDAGGHALLAGAGPHRCGLLEQALHLAGAPERAGHRVEGVLCCLAAADQDGTPTVGHPFGQHGQEV